MEFKKCKRCGDFFVNDSDVCNKCLSKDEYEINKLKQYFETNNQDVSMEEVAVNTGIKLSNLDRHMEKDEFKDISKNFNKIDGFDNLSINL